jgi:MtN3 and saliva related transmembrane protein
MANIDLIGYLAGFIVAISLTPQVIKSWKTKTTKDISIAWTSIYIVGLILWVIYGFGIGSFPVILTVAIEALLTVALLILKIEYG